MKPIELELVSSNPRKVSQRTQIAWIPLTQLLVLIVLILTWEITAHFRTDIRASFPTFTGTAQAFVGLGADPDMWNALLSTVLTTCLATLLCALMGIVLGVAISSRPFATKSSQFIIDFCRNIPSLAVIPIFLLLLGATNQMKIALIVAVGIWPILIQVTLGVQNVDAMLITTAKSFRIPYWRRLVFVVFPAALPYIATGIRICVSVSLLLAIGTELIVGIPGVGREMLISQQSGDAARTFAIILLSGIIGIFLNVSLLKIEKKLLAWHYVPREQNQ